jgi:hypothetical protein
MILNPDLNRRHSYFCSSASADNTSALCSFGFTSVYTFTILPSGLMMKVCLAAT